MAGGRTGRPRKSWLSDKDVPKLADVQAAATSPISPLAFHSPSAPPRDSLFDTNIQSTFTTPSAARVPYLASPVQLRTLYNELPDTGPMRHNLTRSEHLDVVLKAITENFTSFGDFLDCFTLEPPRSGPDTRSSTHKSVLSHWLRGGTNFRPVHFVTAIYRNRYSVPARGSKYRDELERAFDGDCDAKELHYARIGLSAWAAALMTK
ncbi:hypothetical protein CYLTODRAFT_460734 [Cylindrobasidium torrendii FP15055 ss-10]|uniref:Uncharacterized protein n=1 Tax=Cylindrobasidium torrendii FP15055 ss-10 TaxID=1314674 RepID=A0A0D7AR63_9AGAR|nr:hypothetical protein CYLTODRAFT_460734 [Cylindrobasidium torrendii FP15055 ss-10]